VVKVLGTVSESTTGIERPVGSINGNGKGSSTEVIDNFITVSFLGILESSDMVVTTVELTSLVSGGVRVSTGIGDTVLSDVLESLIHPSSVTSLVSEGS